MDALLNQDLGWGWVEHPALLQGEHSSVPRLSERVTIGTALHPSHYNSQTEQAHQGPSFLGVVCG